MTRPGPQRSVFSGSAKKSTDGWEECSDPDDLGRTLAKLQERRSVLQKAGLDFPEGTLMRVQRQSELLASMAGPSQSGPPTSISVSPTLPNVISDRPKYFRAVIWNLENFTHDPRPSGTQPINSIKNQARIAVAAHFGFRHGADALLMMENGSDVGAAMTQMATRWADLEREQQDDPLRDVHPLTTPATHALPDVPMQVLNFALPIGWDPLRALLLAGEGYQIAPHGFVTLTADGLRQAVQLLFETSNNMKGLTLPDLSGHSTETVLQSFTDWCAAMILNTHQDSIRDYIFVSDNDFGLVAKYLSDLVNFPGQTLTQPESEMGELREVILTLREWGLLCSRPDMSVGAIELSELALLAWVLHRGLGSLNEVTRIPGSGPSTIFGPPPDVLLPDTRMFWLNEIGAPMHLVTGALLMGMGNPVDLVSHDPVSGPFHACSDGELLLHALVRLGILPQPRSENYGIAYRPFKAELMKRLLSKKVDLGMKTSGYYGLKHEGEGGSALASQEEGGILAGRTAVQISFPTHMGGGSPSVPFLMHHNRFTGTAEISKMAADFAKETNTINARLLTLEDTATKITNSAFTALNPLIVGDFNTPERFIEDEQKPTRKDWLRTWQQREDIRNRHHGTMAASGYLRRTKASGKNPTTTLKAAHNIALLDDYFSEPYDAVYQPFDFLAGSAKVRSAAVKDYLSFFPPELMEEIISFSTEHGTHAKQFGAFVAEDFQSTYDSLTRMIYYNVKGSADWLRTKNFGDRGAVAYVTDHREELRHELAERSKGLASKWMFDPYRSDDLKEGAVCAKYREAVGLLRAEMLVFIQLDKDTEKAARKDEEKSTGVRRQKPAHERLADIADLLTALQNLEKAPARRFWSLYRRNVSDHVPMMLEVEFL